MDGEFSLRGLEWKGLHLGGTVGSEVHLCVTTGQALLVGGTAAAGDC